MKKYFKNSLKRAVFAPWGLALGTPEAPPGCTYIELPAPAGLGWGEDKGPAFQFQKLIAVEEAVNKERQNYQDKIRAGSSRNYCVVCEKEVVAGQALRCSSCGATGATCSASGAYSEGNEAGGLLPDGFNPNRPPSEPEEGSAPGAAASLPACEGEDSGVRNSQEGGGGETSLIHEFGAGVEVGGEEEPDERPAVWCHHKNCKNDADAKGLLICTKCQRGFHAGAVPVGQRHTPDINSQIYRHYTLAGYQRQCIVSTDAQNRRTIGEARAAPCRFACPALRCLFTPKMPLLMTGACSPQKRRFTPEVPAHRTGACALQRWMYTSKVPTHISGAYSPQTRLYISQAPAHTRDAHLLDGRLYSPGMHAHLRAAGARDRRPYISGELVRLGNAGAPQRYVYSRQATAYPRGSFTPQRYLYTADVPAHPRGDGAHDRRIDTTEVLAHSRGVSAPQRLQYTRQAPTRARVASIPCRCLYARQIPVRSKVASALQRCLYTRFVAVHFEGSSTPVSE
ncbi:hypothetical protein, conserved [Eimeria necatrix]|uniref:Uncharacterized protein n=1 Tax=Eimeria necatrix TaxID=51315 RepID=U6MPX5_9EIME|nr:hypothetical protein, conserved [Eimeria necatrix]CDJ65123.1 hypothetical protein, conserved [Eimeria necatrix]